MGAVFWIFASLIALSIASLHVAAVFLKGRLAALASYINIALHLFALLFLLYNKVALDSSLLAFMTSVLIYLALSSLKFKLESKEDEK